MLTRSILKGMVRIFQSAIAALERGQSVEAIVRVINALPGSQEPPTTPDTPHAKHRED